MAIGVIFLTLCPYGNGETLVTADIAADPCIRGNAAITDITACYVRGYSHTGLRFSCGTLYCVIKIYYCWIDWLLC